jgi:hypothetical protein
MNITVSVREHRGPGYSLGNAGKQASGSLPGGSYFVEATVAGLRSRAPSISGSQGTPKALAWPDSSSSVEVQVSEGSLPATSQLLDDMGRHRTRTWGAWPSRYATSTCKR